jgi:hypothetical protein
LLDFGFRKSITIGQDNFAIDSESRRDSGYQMQVGGVEITRCNKETVQ